MDIPTGFSFYLLLPPQTPGDGKKWGYPVDFTPTYPYQIPNFKDGTYSFHLYKTKINLTLEESFRYLGWNISVIKHHLLLIILHLGLIMCQDIQHPVFSVDGHLPESSDLRSSSDPWWYLKKWSVFSVSPESCRWTWIFRLSEISSMCWRMIQLTTFSCLMLWPIWR